MTGQESRLERMDQRRAARPAFRVSGGLAPSFRFHAGSLGPISHSIDPVMQTTLYRWQALSLTLALFVKQVGVNHDHGMVVST
jgi:hypothetical protein